MLCRVQPGVKNDRYLTVYSSDDHAWVNKGSFHTPLRCMGCNIELGSNRFHLVDNQFMCSTCKVRHYFDVTLICDRDEDGDMLPNVENIPKVIGQIVKHLPTPEQYVSILSSITTHHLCVHSDESQCSMGHRGYTDEPQCSNGIRNDLMDETKDFILYLKLAFMCGGMRTVDKLYMVMRSVSNYFGTDFHIFNLNESNLKKKQCAKDMINVMHDVVSTMQRNGQDAEEST